MTDAGSPRVALALDSAGLACSVAVSLGEEVVAEERIDTLHGNLHTAKAHQHARARFRFASLACAQGTVHRHGLGAVLRQMHRVQAAITA